MTGMLDRETINFPCPHCRHQVAETIGKLKLNPRLTCKACGKDFTVNANELRTALQSVDKQMAHLKRALGRLGK